MTGIDKQLFCPNCQKFTAGWVVLTNLGYESDAELKTVVNADGVTTREILESKGNNIIPYKNLPKGFFETNAEELNWAETQVEMNSQSASCMTCNASLIWAANLSDEYAIIKTRRDD